MRESERANRFFRVRIGKYQYSTEYRLLLASRYKVITVLILDASCWRGSSSMALWWLEGTTAISGLLPIVWKCGSPFLTGFIANRLKIGFFLSDLIYPSPYVTRGFNILNHVEQPALLTFFLDFWLCSWSFHPIPQPWSVLYPLPARLRKPK